MDLSAALQVIANDSFRYVREAVGNATHPSCAEHPHRMRYCRLTA